MSKVNGKKTIRELLNRKEMFRPTIEFLGETWKVKGIPIYNLQDLISQLTANAKEVAREILKPNESEYEVKPVDESQWEQTVKNSPGMVLEKPANLYEQKLQNHTNALLMAELGCALLVDADGKPLSEMVETRSELYELKDAMMEDVQFFQQMAKAISGKFQREAEKND